MHRLVNVWIAILMDDSSRSLSVMASLSATAKGPRSISGAADDDSSACELLDDPTLDCVDERIPVDTDAGGPTGAPEEQAEHATISNTTAKFLGVTTIS